MPTKTTPIRTAIIKKQKTSVRVNGKELESLRTAGGNVKQCRGCGNSLAGPQNLRHRIDPATPLLSIYTKPLTAETPTGIFRQRFVEASFTVAKGGNHLNIDEQMKG